MSTPTHASRPSRVTARWYQLALTVLGLALVAVTALAVYLAAPHTNSTEPPTQLPTSNSESVPEHPCVKLHDPC
jgi:hypothetical protein